MDETTSITELVQRHRQGQYTITQEMVDKAKSSIAKMQYKQPIEDLTTLED